MAAAKLTLPSMLNYTRSIIPSNGVFFYREGDQEKPITVHQQTVRGTIANYGNVYKNDKQQSESDLAKQLDPANANIQRIDVCYLPDAVEQFCLRFSVTFAAHSLAPGACNDTEYAKALEQFAQAYREKDGYTALASRYLQNIINGRWLWRNRYASDKQVTLSYGGKTLVFAVAHELEHDYSTVEGYAALHDALAAALSGTSGVLRLQVTAAGVLGFGQEVYPSQEFVEGKKDKTLAAVKVGEVRQAAMHSQKIGNALRTIDDWHSRAADYGKIAVEPYGVVAQRAEAVRLPNSKSDLYSYLKDLAVWTERVEAASAGALPSEAHYLMACLIRGGVYSGGKKEK
ncbi:MAG: type I-F CRISPR-associated protein Csy3 [Thiothrix lacustris]|uniref:Type I-F CRISPR-associated protein Csy3 n=1 Tax=Thiothrix lacustris TaxID=525917 RepID=A0A1Y1QQJ1_9GAMM|nr:MAG: type I-F CRISPR-associated protein Csy3 [Thiothrix lacustris]